MNENKVVKAGIGYTIGNYLLKGFSFLTVPIFARLLSTEDFGIYSTFIAYETLLYVVIGAALHASYKNAKYRYDIKKLEIDNNLSYAGYKSASMVYLLSNTCLLLLISNILYPILTKWIGLNRLAINLLIIYSFSTATLSCFNADASLNYDHKSYLKIALFNAIGNLALSLIFILTIFSNQRYMGRIVGTVLPMVLVAFFVVYTFIKVDSKRNITAYLRWGLSFSIPIVFHGLSQVVLSQFDRIMIRSINGDTAVGLYSFGYTIFSIVNVTFNSTDAVWSTWFYEKINTGDNKIIRKYSSYYILFVFVLCVSLMLVCPEVIILLGSSKYVESKYCTIPIIASGFFVFLYTLPSGVEYYFEQTKKIATATIIAALINVILNYYFIRRYGYVAAAYTTLFTYILYYLFHHMQAKRILGYHIFSNKIIVISSLLIILFMCLSLLLIDHIALRWGMALLTVLLFILYEENKVALGKKLIKSFLNRRS